MAPIITSFHFIFASGNNLKISELKEINLNLRKEVDEFVKHKDEWTKGS